MTTVQTVRRMTEAECQQWAANPTVNPKTGRAINPNASTGGVYKLISEFCQEKYNIRPNGNATTTATRVSPSQTNTQNHTEALQLLERLEPYPFIDPKQVTQLKKMIRFLTPPEQQRANNVLQKPKSSILVRDVLEAFQAVEWDLSFQFRRFLEGLDITSGLQNIENNLFIIAYGKEFKRIEFHTEKYEKYKKTYEDFKEVAQTMRLEPVERSKSLTQSRVRSDPSSLSDKSTERNLSSSLQRHSKLSKVSPYANEDLPPLEEKTRTQLLKELKRACSEMRDAISYERFDRMNKKNLQLVLKLGPGDGPKQCYYVRNIYNLWKNVAKENKLLEDPLTRRRITADEQNEIMQKMKYISKNAKDPRAFSRSVNKNVELNITHDGVFFHIEVTMKVGHMVRILFDLGYIPANIEPEDVDGAVDLTSAVIITHLRELFDKGRLLTSYVPPFRCCRIHLAKPKDYWLDSNGPKGISKQRLILMAQEIQTYL